VYGVRMALLLEIDVLQMALISIILLQLSLLIANAVFERD